MATRRSPGTGYVGVARLEEAQRLGDDQRSAVSERGQPPCGSEDMARAQVRRTSQLGTRTPPSSPALAKPLTLPGIATGRQRPISRGVPAGGRSVAPPPSATAGRADPPDDTETVLVSTEPAGSCRSTAGEWHVCRIKRRVLVGPDRKDGNALASHPARDWSTCDRGHAVVGRSHLRRDAAETDPALLPACDGNHVEADYWQACTPQPLATPTPSGGGRSSWRHPCAGHGVAGVLEAIWRASPARRRCKLDSRARSMRKQASCAVFVPFRGWRNLTVPKG